MRPLHQAIESVEIGAKAEQVFELLSRPGELARVLPSVRRTRSVGEHRTLWDVDVAGRQVVWEAEIAECLPGERIRWRSVWGANVSGELRVEPLLGDRSRLHVSIECRPESFLGRLGTLLGLVDRELLSNLTAVREHVERAAAESEQWSEPAGAASGSGR